MEIAIQRPYLELCIPIFATENLPLLSHGCFLQKKSPWQDV
jgi:hypothetical protein